MFWLGIYGSVLAETARSHGTKELFLYTAAILVGIIAWDFFMALTASSFRKLLYGPLIRMISYASAVSLIGFGIYFGWQACLVLLQ
jgi:threonine/homoserine/homoserine lactone efflux protein